MNRRYLGIAVTVLVGGTIAAVGWSFFSGTPVSAEVFSTDTTGLPDALASETVELEDGDSYNLTASIVKKRIGDTEVKMLAYNGMIPGPLIKVKQGAEVILNFTNNTDVENTIHSHGVRLANEFDGVPEMTQKSVGPGESFTYSVKFPDEGMYWYHPHVREDYAQELGLYGNYLVVPDDPDYWSPVNREVALFVDDVLMENGSIAAFRKTSADRTLMGRYGNIMLVNGETDYRLTAKTGEIIRFFITNSANTRTFNLSVPGAKVKLVGADGGKYERETWIDNVILGPSERAVVEVLFSRAGSYEIRHTTPDLSYSLGAIDVSGEKVDASFEDTFLVLRSNADIQSGISALRQYFRKPADKRLSFSIDMGSQMLGMMPGGTGSHTMGGGSQMTPDVQTMAGGDPIEWEESNAAMNMASDAAMMSWILKDEETGKRNEDIDWRFKVGDRVKIAITNDPNSMHPMQHPFHIHGQRFLVLSSNGIPNNNLVWKDTVLIPNGDTVELLVDMTNPGVWMAHCHIAEHLEAGMAMSFRVE